MEKNKGKSKEPENNIIYIGNKSPVIYFNSVLFALAKFPKIKILSRGKYIKISIDILAKLLRKFTNGKYNIKVKNILFNERYITEVEIEFEK